MSTERSDSGRAPLARSSSSYGRLSEFWERFTPMTSPPVDDDSEEERENNANSRAEYVDNYERSSDATPQSISDIQLLLLNNGSVARDHLASERTFMAYVRTSLAMASAGVALMQLMRIGASANHEMGRLLAGMTISTGLFILLVGTVRFFLVQRTLTTGFFPVARVGMVGITSMIGVSIGVALYILSPIRS